MPIKSQFDSQCYDCGTKYKTGDEIAPNGNKTKAGKAHWCKNGTNCQGAMKIDGFEHPEARKGVDFKTMLAKKSAVAAPITPREPTTTELWNKLATYTNELEGDGNYQMIRSYLNQRRACEEIGITNPITIGMIWNNYIRNNQ